MILQFLSSVDAFEISSNPQLSRHSARYFGKASRDNAHPRQASGRDTGLAYTPSQTQRQIDHVWVYRLPPQHPGTSVYLTSLVNYHMRPGGPGVTAETTGMTQWPCCAAAAPWLDCTIGMPFMFLGQTSGIDVQCSSGYELIDWSVAVGVKARLPHPGQLPGCGSLTECQMCPRLSEYIFTY